jgi:predicted PurR-regulated permease PerM
MENAPSQPHTTPMPEPDEPLIPPLRVTRSERNRLILVGLAALVLLWLLNQSWDALVPFIIALVLAYLMAPLVELIARFVPRAVAILLVYVVFIVVVVGFVAWLTPVVRHQVDALSEQIPTYQLQAQDWGRDIIGWYNSLPISDDVRQSIENSVRNSLGAVGSAVQQGVVNTVQALSRAMGFLVGMFIIPFWLFYVLKDKDRGISAFNHMLPRTWRNDVWRIVRIINGILSSYIRGQLLLGLVVGLAVTIGMFIVGAPFAVLLGIISGITEVIPVIGPILGAIPGFIIAIFHPEGWVMVLKVLAVYVIVQQLENNLLVPKIQGDSVKLHPSLIMVALVVGSQVGGLFGLIVAVPVAAILRDVYLYLYRRYTESYSPREAEASVPSREDESSDKGRTREEQELKYQESVPGVQSANEVLMDIEQTSDGRDETAASKRQEQSTLNN